MIKIKLVIKGHIQHLLIKQFDYRLEFEKYIFLQPVFQKNRIFKSINFYRSF